MKFRPTVNLTIEDKTHNLEEALNFLNHCNGKDRVQLEECLDSITESLNNMYDLIKELQLNRK